MPTDAGRPYIGTIATLILGLATVASTYLHGRAETRIATMRAESEISLAHRKQVNDARTQYLVLTIDPARTVAQRQSVLRFLLATSDDGSVRSWSQDELKALATEAEQREALAKTQRELRAAQAALRRAEKDAKSREEYARIVEDILVLERQRDAIDAKLPQNAQALLRPLSAQTEMKSMTAEGRSSVTGDLTVTPGQQTTPK